MRPEPGGSERTASLPTGTVTFLFTDIEGSTQRWEQHREAIRAPVARHEQLLAAAMQQHGGYVFKTVGDVFCVAFPTAPDAVRAAALAQPALAKEDFSAVGQLWMRAVWMPASVHPGGVGRDRRNKRTSFGFGREDRQGHRMPGSIPVGGAACSWPSGPTGGGSRVALSNFTIQHQSADAAFRRRGRSTKSAASSASLRSVLRDVPIRARIVRPRARSRTWLARAATGKSGGISPALIPIAETAFHQLHGGIGRLLQELPDLSVVHERRDAHEKTSRADPFSVALADGVPQKARASREECAARGVPSRRERPSSRRTPGGRARISSAWPQKRNTGSAARRPSRRRDRRSSLRRSPSDQNTWIAFSSAALSSKLRGRPRGLAVF